MKQLFFLIVIVLLASCGSKSGHLLEGKHRMCAHQITYHGPQFFEIATASKELFIINVDTMYKAGDTIRHDDGFLYVLSKQRMRGGAAICRQ